MKGTDNENTSDGIPVPPWVKILRKRPRELISRDELDKLVQACQNERDRAFISALYESGARIGQLRRDIILWEGNIDGPSSSVRRHPG